MFLKLLKTIKSKENKNNFNLNRKIQLKNLSPHTPVVPALPTTDSVPPPAVTGRLLPGDWSTPGWLRDAGTRSSAAATDPPGHLL